MENKGKCYWCKYFTRYYTKGNKQFNRLKIGWCSNKQEQISSQEGCEHYRYHAPAKPSHRSAFRTLNDLLTELSEIRMVIEDNNREIEEYKKMR